MAIELTTLLGQTIYADDATLVIGDAFKTVDMDKATALTLTVPPNSDVAFPINTLIYVRRTDAGALTIAAGVGVTITSSSTGLTDPGLNIVMSLRKTGTNTWDLQNGAPPQLAWGAWTPTVTGFSSTTTLQGTFVRIPGTRIGIVTYGVSGTSSGTTFTITNLPLTPAGTSRGQAHGVNNGTAVICLAATSVGSAVLTLHNAGNASGWLGSGTKQAFGTIIIELQS
jgi:hypothetical protein